MITFNKPSWFVEGKSTNQNGGGKNVSKAHYVIIKLEKIGPRCWWIAKNGSFRGN